MIVFSFVFEKRLRKFSEFFINKPRARSAGASRLEYGETFLIVLMTNIHRIHYIKMDEHCSHTKRIRRQGLHTQRAVCVELLLEYTAASPRFAPLAASRRCRCG